jgi:hypothetical protein
MMRNLLIRISHQCVAWVKHTIVSGVRMEVIYNFPVGGIELGIKARFFHVPG